LKVPPNKLASFAFDPIKLEVSSVYDKISGKSGSPGPDDPFAKTGEVWHVDGKVMPENVRECELGACDSQRTNMILDNASYVEDDSSAHIEDTKLCIKGDNSSSRSSMRVKETDYMEELSMKACSSINSNMEFEELNMNPKSMAPDMTSVNS